MRLGLGEGGVVAAGSADQRPAGAAAAGRQQVAAAFAVEEGRARTGRRRGRRPRRRRRCLSAPGPDSTRSSSGPALIVSLPKPPAKRTLPIDSSEPFHPEAVVARAEVGHQPAARAVGRTGDGRRAAAARARSPGRSPAPFLAVTPKVCARFVEGDDELVAATAADHLQAGAAARRRVELDVGGAARRRLLAAGAGPPFRALAAVGALAAFEDVGAAAADQVVVAEPTRRSRSPAGCRSGCRGRPSLRGSRSRRACRGRRRGPDAAAARPRRRCPCRPRRAVAKEAMSPLPAPPDMRS